MNRLMTIAVLFTAGPAMQAQVPDQIREATIHGSPGTSGKCTIEVRVDISAEVDVYGTAGRLRTLAGQPATWTRMECTAPLPYKMSDFRFRGIDGRGSVRLAQDPRNNNSMAVIRIDDPKGGAEGYTFEIQWSGASGGAPVGGFSTGANAATTLGYPSEDAGSTRAGGTSVRRRGAARNISAERAIDLCRTEVRTRAERDYGLRKVDITAAGVDTSAGRRDWVTGSFDDRARGSRRGAAYRFHCGVDYRSGQVHTVEILRADGSTVQPVSTPAATSSSAVSGQAGSEQAALYRACQDAVVARTARDGYQNVNFTSIAMDTSRRGRVAGAISASRGPVSDTFDFGCSMNLTTGAVRNLELTRR